MSFIVENVKKRKTILTKDVQWKPFWEAILRCGQPLR